MINIKSSPGTLTWEFNATREELRLSVRVQSRSQHRKLLEILEQREHFPFRGDPQFIERLKRRQAREAEADRKKAASDPEYAEGLVELEASIRELDRSIEEDPNDDQNPWSEGQLRVRAETRARKRRDLLGEDLPGALKEMLDELREHDENDIPYTLELLEPHILAMAELLRDWRPTETKKTPRSSQLLFDPAHSDTLQPDFGAQQMPNPEGELDNQLKRLLEALEANAALARQYVLCKTRTRAPRARLPGSQEETGPPWEGRGQNHALFTYDTRRPPRSNPCSMGGAKRGAHRGALQTRQAGSSGSDAGPREKKLSADDRGGKHLVAWVDVPGAGAGKTTGLHRFKPYLLELELVGPNHFGGEVQTEEHLALH